MPSRKSPYRPNETCHEQQRPNLNGPAAALGASDAAPGTSASAVAAGQRALRAARTRRLAKLRAGLVPFGDKTRSTREALQSKRVRP